MLKKLLAVIVMLFATASFAAVDVNTATEAELDGIKGIGPGLSSKILAERKSGDFKDWNDFIGRVSGVGNKSAVNFSKDGLTVDGKKFSAAAAAKAETRDKKHSSNHAAHKAAPAATAPAVVTPVAPTAAAPAVAPSASASKN